MKLYTHEELLDLHIGLKGTPERDAYDKQLEDWFDIMVYDEPKETIIVDTLILFRKDLHLQNKLVPIDRIELAHFKVDKELMNRASYIIFEDVEGTKILKSRYA